MYSLLRVSLYIISRHFQFILLNMVAERRLPFRIDSYFKSCIIRKMYLQLNPNRSGGMWAHPPPCGVGFLQNLRTTYTESRVSSEKEKSFFKKFAFIAKKKNSPQKFRIFPHFVHSRKMQKFSLQSVSQKKYKILRNRIYKNFVKKRMRRKSRKK